MKSLFADGVSVTSPNSPLLNVLNSNASILNGTSASLSMIPNLSGQRVYDESIMTQYNQDPHASSNDHVFNGVLKSDPGGRIFQQGSDGDSLPESPMSSGHDGKI